MRKVCYCCCCCCCCCRGPSIYEKQVLPVLEAAGLTRGEHLTKHRGHATEILSRTAPGEYDVVVSIGEGVGGGEGRVWWRVWWSL